MRWSWRKSSSGVKWSLTGPHRKLNKRHSSPRNMSPRTTCHWGWNDGEISCSSPFQGTFNLYQIVHYLHCYWSICFKNLLKFCKHYHYHPHTKLSKPARLKSTCDDVAVPLHRQARYSSKLQLDAIISPLRNAVCVLCVAHIPQAAHRRWWWDLELHSKIIVKKSRASFHFKTLRI